MTRWGLGGTVMNIGSWGFGATAVVAALGI